VLVDCTQLSFIDSTGVLVLLEAHRDLLAEGREMLVANVPPHCTKVFDILGVRDLLRYDRAENLSA
jgi:anti-anti-sigma factor